MSLSTISSALTLSPWCLVQELCRPIAIRVCQGLYVSIVTVSHSTRTPWQAGEFVQISETQYSVHLAAGGLTIGADVYCQGRKYLGGWALDEDMKSWYPTSLWQLESAANPIKGQLIDSTGK